MNGPRSVPASSGRRLGLPLFWRWTTRATTFVAMLTVAGAAFAADDAKIIYPGGSPVPAAPAVTGGGVANTLTLIVAILLAAVGGWMFWRNRRITGLGRDTRALAVEETRSLGNRQYLVVASYEGKKFLLGVCPGRIDLLAPLTDRREGESAS